MIIFPLSLTPLDLFKIDSVKSPIIAEKPIKNPKTIILAIEPGNIFTLKIAD